MGALAAAGVGADLVVRIAPGADGLDLQRFQPVAGGHLTGHHPAQIVLQPHLVDHQDFAVLQRQFHTAFIGGNTVASLQGRNPDLLR